MVGGRNPAIMRERASGLLPNFTEAQALLVKESYGLFMLSHYSFVLVADCNSVKSTTNCSDLNAGWACDKGVDDSRYPDNARWAGASNFKCSGFNGYPQAYRDTLHLAHAYDQNAGILLTENGWCGNDTIDNQDQLWYFQTHLEQVYKVITEDCIPIIGYHAWAMMDNYEWSNYKQHYGVGGGLMATVAEGFAFGTGSAIARHGVNAVVDSFSGSKDEPVAQPVTAAPAPATRALGVAAVCASDNKAFLDCIDRNTHDVAACQFYLDALNQCKQQSVNI
ncbi:hypothetical protein G195_010111 [Phytophthora kernoviae 00238/432]|uniref:CHCH domain-containing protein n=1 Tax=Phytophthora kernoviae 00238/432 TaxID=1284355 RepID=A0A8J4W1K6_9STRA|nr:hypothetical protein G195_010111 [Phytophthora kernoviae 00238/432]